MKMAKFTEQLQRIVEDYRAAGQPWPASTQEMAEWAVAHDRYQLMRGMAVNQCASKIGRAMGLEHVRDKKGRSIRKYYAARVQRDGNCLWFGMISMRNGRSWKLPPQTVETTFSESAAN